MKRVKEDILRLRAEGKSYRAIAKELNCSKSAVSYHCGKGQKEKASFRNQKNRATRSMGKRLYLFKSGNGRASPKKSKKKKNGSTTKTLLNTRVSHFRRKGHDTINISKQRYKKAKRRSTEAPPIATWTREQFEEKFKARKHCYLSGRTIDFYDPSTYSLDHITPNSLGGTNELSNCQLARPEANQAKGYLTIPEFLALCQNVLGHHGYMVIPPKEETS